MKRMHALCLMPSHTFYYKKLNEFGMDYDKDILEKVKTEGKRKETEAAKMSKLSCMSDVRGPSSMSDTIQPKECDTACSTMLNTCNTVASENVLSSSIATECNIQGSDNPRNKIMQSSREEDSLEDTQPQQNKLLVFSSWKAGVSLKSMKPSFTDASTGNIDQTLADNVNHDLTVPGKLQLSDKLYPSDTGRKFVLDNVDVLSNVSVSRIMSNNLGYSDKILRKIPAETYRPDIEENLLTYLEEICEIDVNNTHFFF